MSDYESALPISRVQNVEDAQGQERPNTLGQIKTTVSNKLNEFADSLEAKAQNATGNKQELSRYGTQAADWMKRSARYIEDFDAQRLKEDITGQVRRNPGKTLLIATAAGLVLGSLLRRR